MFGSSKKKEKKLVDIGTALGVITLLDGTAYKVEITGHCYNGFVLKADKAIFIDRIVNNNLVSVGNDTYIPIHQVKTIEIKVSPNLVELGERGHSIVLR